MVEYDKAKHFRLSSPLMGEEMKVRVIYLGGKGEGL
jgi:hypothetical protein